MSEVSAEVSMDLGLLREKKWRHASLGATGEEGDWFTPVNRSWDEFLSTVMLVNGLYLNVLL